MKKYFFPSYSEATLFLTAFAGFCLLMVDRGLTADFVVEAKSDSRMWAIGAFVLFGGILSLYHGFSKERKSEFHKRMMALFVLTVNGATGMAGAFLLFDHSQGWLIIFPIWNLFTSMWLFVLMRTHNNIGEFVDERDAFAHELFIGVVVITGIIYLFNVHLGAPWPITFGASVGYATTFNNALNALVFRTT